MHEGQKRVALPAIRRGRFAPSPTGPLHLGSLVSALASWLDAKAQGYAWLVRIEDIDPPREEPAAADFILRQLCAHGLQWDQDPHPQARKNGVLYQSDRSQAYEQALNRLIGQGMVYACTCSRKKLHDALENGLTQRSPDGEIIYPGFCKKSGRLMTGVKPPAEKFAWRFDHQNEKDDFIIRRSDSLWAYHLACVVDDADQGITDIVRGDDLVSAAPKHEALRRALGFSDVRLLHVPVVRNHAGEKLSKQTQAASLEIDSATRIRDQLIAADAHLRSVMPQEWLKQTRPYFEVLLKTY